MLVVDDEERTRKVRKLQLEEGGWSVLLAASSDEAMRELAASPHVDAVITDASLIPNDPTDRSGIDLARTIRELFGPDLPIMAYSAYVADRPLTDEERALFTHRVPKAIMKPGEIGQHLGRLESVARKHRQKRVEQSKAAHEQMRDRVSLEPVDPAETVRRLMPEGVAPAGVELALRDAGYKLQLVHSPVFKPSADPILVWTRERREGEEAEAEVYGQPTLYAHSGTVQDAVSQLVELMRLFAEDFSTSEMPAAGPAQRLQQFLEETIQVSDPVD